MDTLSWLLVLALKGDGMAKKLQARQRWLSSLPCDGYLLVKTRQNARENLLERSQAHPMFVPAVDRFGRQVITIGTVEVAQRTHWLDHHRDATGLDHWKAHVCSLTGVRGKTKQ